MGSLFLLHIQMAKTNKVSSELGAQILDFVCDDGRVDCNDLLTSITEKLQPRRTNPVVWCGAILCMIFSILLIFFGVATLVVVLVIKPKNPVFDTPAARLNLIYFDTPVNFNGDFTFLANFSNPSRKLDVRFEYGDVELYFYDSLIASQAFQPFTLRRGEARLASVHMISSLVFLPPNLALELQQHVQSNRVIYNIRGTFRVRANLGLIHFSYWLRGRCQLEMTSPPIGALLARSCRTKR
ncbi:hypothetical protein TEA_017384 [Camellia sinensis var. sinensis]|uniref:Late embryogenesis abundant protein LEA-2 subgroup domain-containing protein n=1 Tax=Camellia sinensis var. sinensis TaxID=542762 RepID=A0A4S4DZ36_CAMSN|nr:hypothetical protein TEA_017384 [Camellia sinensis var. sinensis]